MLASLASGTSRIRGILRSTDTESTAAALRSLGAPLPSLSDDVSITGVGLRGMRSPGSDLDCGNSGTAARLLAGVVAGQKIKARFIGDSSLSARPMKRVADPLTAMGASFAFERGDGLPMTVSGSKLRPIDYDTRSASAQVKSAILLAGLVSEVEVTVRETARSRDHTERMLIALGARVTTSGTVTRFTPVQALRPLDITVPRDPSSAAFFLALGTLADDGELTLPGVCTNPTRGGFIAALVRMGGSVELLNPSSESGEEIATLRVRPSGLHSLQIAAEEISALIDELPVLSCLAAGAGVALEVRGAEELRAKESDRIRAIVENLRRVGADADERSDGLVVREGRRKLRGAVVTQGDHRIAMAFGILAKLPGNEISIDDPRCVAVSYPDFWNDLAKAVA